MLAFFAAVIPIIGALYVAGSVLVHQLRLDRERKVRLSIIPEVHRWHSRMLAESRESAEPTDYDAISAALNAWHAKVLSFHGIEGIGPTAGEHAADLSMSAPRMPAVERRRQWVLLLSAVVGLVLLALDVGL